MQNIHIPKGSADQAKGMMEFTFTSFLATIGSFSMTSPLPLKKKNKSALRLWEDVSILLWFAPCFWDPRVSQQGFILV